MARKRKLNDEQPESEYDVLIGFVHEFKFLSENDLGRLNGHPTEGRVYRILKDPYGYRIHIGRDNNKEGLDGLFLGETLEGEQSRYSFKIEVVTPTNYLALPIMEDDRTKVMEWVQSDNNDLWQNLNKEQSGEGTVIRTGADLLKVIMNGGALPNAESTNSKMATTTSTSASLADRERAIEATLTLLTHFKKKNINELVALYDAMYGRILNNITR